MAGDPIYINNGVAQHERLPQELDPAQLRIDERNTIDLLSFIGDYTKLLNYYDGSSGKLARNGSWSFFAERPLFYIARIAAYKTGDAKSRLALSVLGNYEETLTNKIYALRLLFEIVVSRIRAIDEWLMNVDLLPPDYAARLQTMVHDTLAEQLIELQAYNDLYVRWYRLVPYNFFDLPQLLDKDALRRWELEDYADRVGRRVEELDADFIKAESELEENPVLFYTSLVNKYYLPVSVIYQSFDNSINYLVGTSLRLLEQEIAQSHDMKPDMALLLSFLKLFQRAQDSLNTNTGKHLNFYYDTVLQLQLRPQQPDRVYIAMDLVPTVQAYVLPEGIGFDAGKDPAGNPMVFVNTRETILNQARAAVFLTQYVARNPLVSTGILPQWITGIYNSSHGNPMITGEAAWPLFGEEQLMFGDDEETMQTALPGFALSSPALFLSGGERLIHLKLVFSKDSYENAFLPALSAVTDEHGGTDETTFYTLLENAFAAKATSPKGWTPLSITGLSYSKQEHSISFDMTLDGNVPALVAYDSKVHGPSYQTPHPIICFELQYGLPYYAYNFVKDLVIEKAQFNVEVNGLSNLALYNQYGLLDPSKPFQPLAVQPAKGAYFMVGSKELFIKRSSEVTLAIEWQNLPETDFKTYYANYNTTVDTDSFKVNATYLKDYRWQIPGLTPQVDNLFDTAAGTKVPLPVSVFQIGPLRIPITSNNLQAADMATPLVYNNNTESGFIRFELVAPAEGFGASLYSNALSQVVLANATESEKTPLPNPPFTPVAKDVQLSYKASDELNFLTLSPASDALKTFYHLGPFATYPAVARCVPSSMEPAKKTTTTGGDPVYGNRMFLVPEFGAEGTLFIGLDNFVPPLPVSLWFQLQDKAVEESMANPPQIRWSYLANNVWHPLEAGNTIQDATKGFIRSGVIVFDLPGDINTTNTIMPAGLFWIRAQADANTQVFGNVLAVYEQVAELVYSPSPLNQRSSLDLPPLTISKPIDGIPQIKAIHQPFKSWGGRKSENKTEFRTRVSERLRHKQRAITAWDYERLVLEKYPAVYKAKCLTASTLAVLGPSDGIELVVIPGVNSEGAVQARDAVAPVFSFTLLEEVEQYLKGLSSVHARIHVRNPVYEALRVRCSVCFNTDNPFYVQQLTSDINSFLSPWDNNNLNIGSGIQPSTILGYIQKLSYVKFVTGFSVIKVAYKEGRSYIFDTAKNNSNDKDTLYALTPWSVFVPFSTHLIDVIDAVDYIEPQPTGIGQLTIGSDFVVKRTAEQEGAQLLKLKPAQEKLQGIEPPSTTNLFRI